jgi:hypothetical protein
MQTRTQFHPITDIPTGVQTKVLLKTLAGIVLVGILFEDGTPGIYDFCCDRYIARDDWNGFAGWMAIPD